MLCSGTGVDIQESNHDALSLQNLQQEQVAIRDLRTIAETLAEHGGRSQDAGVLSARVRVALGRQIVQNIFGMASELTVMTLPRLWNRFCFNPFRVRTAASWPSNPE